MIRGPAFSGVVPARLATSTCGTTRRQFLGAFAAGLAAPAMRCKPLSSLPAESRATAPVAKLPTGLVCDLICKCHLTGPHARECPQRFDAVLGALSASPYFAKLRRFPARPATDEEILACHSSAYLARVRREIESGAKRLSTGDTWVCRESLKAAHYASGAGLRGRRRRACAARPRTPSA